MKAAKTVNLDVLNRLEQFLSCSEIRRKERTEETKISV